MSQVVGQRDGFTQVLVCAAVASQAAGDLCDFQRVREPIAEMVVESRSEHLRLIAQPAKCGARNNSVPIQFERLSERVGYFNMPAYDVWVRAVIE
jgi:hypothetical protein